MDRTLLKTIERFNDFLRATLHEGDTLIGGANNSSPDGNHRCVAIVLDSRKEVVTIDMTIEDLDAWDAHCGDQGKDVDYDALSF